MQVLTQELNRVNEQISKLSFYKDKLTTLISAHETTHSGDVTSTVTVTRKSKANKKAVLTTQLTHRIAGNVAQNVRNGLKKSEAIAKAIHEYKLPKTEAIRKRLNSAITPSGLGKERYDELFAGTKYVSE